MASDGLPPLIASQLNYLLSHHALDVKVEQMWSGNKYYPGVLDRFTIAIPFCLDVVKWDVIYNAESPMSAPDIIFGPEDESFHPFSAKSPKNCSLLDDWNSRDPTRLMALIQELRNQYVDYQRKRVGDVDDARLNFEISTIVFREGIEMALSSGAEKPDEVKFAVPITDMKIDRMVPGCPWRGPPKIYLQVMYPVGKKHVTAPLAPRLKLVSNSELKAFFSIEDVKLPPWSDGMCMAEYLPHLEESLEKQILEAVSLIDVRRRFIEALVPQFGWPLEADPVFCRKATFLAGSGVFTFLVHFMISTQFPKQQPALMLQSCQPWMNNCIALDEIAKRQHLSSQGVPVKSSLMTEYPWSPRWETSQMAERICEFLADEALNFKRHCNESQLQH